MNNLERKLIELTFPTVNVDSLMEIIVATPNATIATEILCGVYQEPVFIQDKLTSSSVARTFMSYDKWSEEITYKYQEEETIYEYFPKGTHKESVNANNYKSLKCGYNEDACRIAIETGRINTKVATCSVKDWDRLKDNNFELSGAELEATL